MDLGWWGLPDEDLLLKWWPNFAERMLEAEGYVAKTPLWVVRKQAQFMMSLAKQDLATQVLGFQQGVF